MSEQTTSKSRIGFHYFQDTIHYTSKDLGTWLPRLKDLSAGWVILQADSSRAIPETFISSLIGSGITPIIHMALPLPNTPDARDLKTILEAYSRWGVKHVILFDKPNLVQSWSLSSWSQEELVERFVDRFLPVALQVSQLKMIPVFPPLHPGGDYWDLIFLKQALASIVRRGRENLINHMAFCAYAYTFEHELTWGSGAQSRWTEAKPYEVSENTQDQRGFNQYEWMNTIVRSFTRIDAAFFLLGAGAIDNKRYYTPEEHAEVIQRILDRLTRADHAHSIPGYVKSCAFYSLCADENDPAFDFAWYRPDGSTLPIVASLLNQSEEDAIKDVEEVLNPEPIIQPGKFFIFDHYLLIPDNEESLSKFNLKAIQPFIQQYHPTIGFSTEDAAKARRVTLIGDSSSIPPEFIEKMQENGCIVDLISEDGTNIATTPVER